MIAEANAAQIPIASGSIHCVVTSPPYWGLRQYAGDQGRIWGGKLDCDHAWRSRERKMQTGGASAKQQSNKGITGEGWIANDALCSRCGAWYGSLGLEPEPELYIANLVEIFREIYRILRPDGVVWLNLSDSYAGSGGENANTGLGMDTAEQHGLYRANPRREKIPNGNLMMLPARVALALQEDGWIVRQRVIWSKPNPMPEPVNGARWEFDRRKISEGETSEGGKDKAGLEGSRNDAERYALHLGGSPYAEYEYGDDLQLKRGSWRHTSSSEDIYMLSKQMHYWSNKESVKEPTDRATSGNKQRWIDAPDRMNTHMGSSVPWENDGAGRNPRSVMDIADPRSMADLWMAFLEAMSNPFSVVKLSVAPYKGAHYATFPPDLIAPLIQSTCPRWACPYCGAGWAPIVKIEREILDGDGKHKSGTEQRSDGSKEGAFEQPSKWITRSSVIGYERTCEHEHSQEDAQPGLCFDPFVGSGTTVAVAQQLLRRGVGIDISREYLDQQAKIRAGLGTPSTALEDLPLFSKAEGEKG